MTTIIVGAGLSGLLIARALNSTVAEASSVQLFEKSRGVGGRMATRRGENSKFDHGAQFYRLREPLMDCHKRWLARGLVKKWFETEGLEHYCANAGMTALAKDLAQDLNVVLNERLVRLERSNDGWVCHFESGLSKNANRVILTCPLPQSLEILSASSIPTPLELTSIQYTKAVVGLFESVSSNFQFHPSGYLEPERGNVFSIADQQAKGISETRALTITMKPGFSETHFDKSDQEIESAIRAEIESAWPAFESPAMQVKKWRYCQVKSTAGSEFLKVSENLYLAGDAFGGASLNGAARSAQALVSHLR